MILTLTVNARTFVKGPTSMEWQTPRYNPSTEVRNYAGMYRYGNIPKALVTKPGRHHHHAEPTTAPAPMVLSKPSRVRHQSTGESATGFDSITS